MSEGRCGAEISSIRETAGEEAGWLDKFENTCSLDAGHEGEHVFSSADDDEHLRFDEATKRFGSYRDAPAEGVPAVLRFDSVTSE
jgi:hypothetical protein